MTKYLQANLPTPILRLARDIYYSVVDLNYRYGIPKTHSLGGSPAQMFELINIAKGDDMVEALIKSGTEGDVLLDVGASVGFTALAFAVNVSESSVDAIEPHPEVCEYLDRNVELNSLDHQININNVAASDEDGTATLHVSANRGNSSLYGNSLHDELNYEVNQVEVTKRRIDTLLEEGVIQAPDVIKIDVEGHGLSVLRGAERTIREYRPTIIPEPHIGNGEHSEAAFMKFFDRWDYSVRKPGVYWIAEP